MSHSTNARRNINQRHPIVFFKYYLRSINEPRDVESRTVSVEYIPAQIKNSDSIRFQFRQLAQKLREENH